jgi:4-diphosphocytidyl-2-C-methyl-D-erythritol kinase
MKIKSFAKINLGLEVIKKRKDGYHEIKTLFQTIDLFDILDFSQALSDEICLEGDDETIPWDRNNLIFKAALLLKEQSNVSTGIRVNVTKNIPAGRGLGGGSSNAAMTLYALNKRWGLGLKKKDLIELGKKLGADVPFFFEGGLCLGLERGDKIVPLEELPPLVCVLALPPFSISTANIYGHFPSSLTSKDKDSKINEFLETREFGFLENRLEETIFSLYPQLKDIKSLFQNQEAELSLVSGTGSAVFGFYLEREKAEKGLEELKKASSSLLVEILSRESYWNRVSAGV